MENQKVTFEVGKRLENRQWSPYRSVYPVFLRVEGTSPTDKDLWGFLTIKNGWGTAFRVVPICAAVEEAHGYYAGYKPDNGGYGTSIYVGDRKGTIQAIEYARDHAPTTFAKFKTAAQLEVEAKELDEKTRKMQVRYLENSRGDAASLRAQIALMFRVSNELPMSAEESDAGKALVLTLATQLNLTEERIRKAERELITSKSKNAG